MISRKRLSPVNSSNPDRHLGCRSKDFGDISSREHFCEFMDAELIEVEVLVGLPTEFIAASRLVIVGVGLIAFILWREGGLVAERIGGSRLA